MRKLLLILASICFLTSAAVTNQELIQIQINKKYTPLWAHRATLFNDLGCDSTNIVMLGNSITHYCEWSELLRNPRVINRGISGDIVQGLVDRIDCVVDGKPEKIFLLIGVNDVSHDLTADSIATAIGGLVDIIRTRTPNTKLYVQSILPINNSFGRYKRLAGKEQVIRDINTLIEPMVKAKGATWINIHPHFTDADGNLRADWTSDGLHLSNPAYQAWREILLPYVNE